MRIPRLRLRNWLLPLSLVSFIGPVVTFFASTIPDLGAMGCPRVDRLVFPVRQ